MLDLGKELHHAYLLEGERSAVLAELQDLFDGKLKIKRQGNPDYSEEFFDTLTIDNARAIEENQMRMSSHSAGQKIFVIGFNFITREAQNALLKVFEEPTEGTHFFLIAQRAEDLLSTLKSRLLIVRGDEKGEGGGEDTHPKMAKEFVASTKAERIKMLKSFIEEIADEEKSKAEAGRFLDALEREIYKKQGAVPVLQTILKAKDYARDRSSSLKLILESVALSLE